MKNKKMIISIFILIACVITIFFNKIISKENDNIVKVVDGYSFEISETNIINKKYIGNHLESFATIVKESDVFTIKLEGIKADSNVFIVNPTNGDRILLKYDKKVFSTDVSLEKDIDYGIIIDYGISGIIRVVEDINNISDQLFEDILFKVGCGVG